MCSNLFLGVGGWGGGQSVCNVKRDQHMCVICSRAHVNVTNYVSQVCNVIVDMMFQILHVKGGSIDGKYEKAD